MTPAEKEKLLKSISNDIDKAIAAKQSISIEIKRGEQTANPIMERYGRICASVEASSFMLAELMPISYYLSIRLVILEYVSAVQMYLLEFLKGERNGSEKKQLLHEKHEGVLFNLKLIMDHFNEEKKNAH